MKTWLGAFSVVFYVGFFALISALAFSLIVFGTLWEAQPVLASLRALGLTLIATGFTMWVMLRRAQAGRDALNPAMGAPTAAGVVMAIAAMIWPYAALSPALQIGAVGAALAGLVVALILVLFDPAFPHPVAATWPEGGNAVLTRFAHPEEAHHHSPAPEDEPGLADAGVEGEAAEPVAETGSHTA